METRTFRMNRKLLMDIITRQAGTVEKSWLEIVQNSIDAKATEVAFIIKPDRFIAKDNGKGMNKKEILTYFEEFGNSSKASSDLGEFGMGRGQIFSQGKTLWRTQDYKMIVDIKEKGLNYILDRADRLFEGKGTHITCFMYNKIKFLEKKIERFIEWCKFAEIKIEINGEQINKELQNYTETDDGIIKLIDDSLIKIYNRGLFVKEEPFGNGAIIVSRKNLKVNFARNDIMEDCPIYNRLLNKTKELIADKLMLKESLTGDDRRTIIHLMREDISWAQTFKDKKIIPTSNQNYVSLEELKGKTIYFSDGKNSYEDDLLITKGNFILKNIPIIRSILNESIGTANVGDYQQLVQTFRYVAREEVHESQLNKTELENWNKIKQINDQISGVIKRQLKIAKNIVANADTDGKRVITINYKLLSEFNVGFIKYLLLHEYSHSTNTENTDEHGYEFYEQFYELTRLNSHILGL